MSEAGERRGAQLRLIARIGGNLLSELPPLLRWLGLGVLLAGAVYVGWPDVADEAAREVLEGTGEGSELLDEGTSGA